MTTIAQWFAENWLLAASLALNVLLGISWFFRSALNSIVSDWYQARRKRNDQTRDILLELNARLSSYFREYFMVMVTMRARDSADNPADREAAHKSFMEAADTMRSHNDFFDQHELRFPESIRSQIKELRQALIVPGAALGRALTAPEVVAQSDPVAKIVRRLQAGIQRLVR